MPTDAPAPPPGLSTTLTGPSPRQRVDALLSEPDTAAAVAALTVQELHELVTQLGFDGAAELVALATPAQLQGCVDLDLWDRDLPALERLHPWLASLVDAGFETLGRAWEGLDAELRALFVARTATVFDLTLGEEPDDQDGQATLYFTPDRFFALALTCDEDTTRLVMRVVDDLYRHDGEVARHTLMAARSEPTPELEEQAYRWRSGRMADLGYVDFYEALELFAPLEPEQLLAGAAEAPPSPAAVIDGATDGVRLPAVAATELLDAGFLARAFARLDAEAADQLASAVAVLTNRLLAAARISPGDHDALRRGARYATSTLSLGLEVVSRGDLARAEGLLRAVSLTRLHRVGYTVTLRLARLARSLAPRALLAGEPAAATVTALTAARPWMSRGLEEPPAAGVRPFASQADLRRAAEVLGRLALRIAVAERLGVDLEAAARRPEPRPALDDHARTAMVAAALGLPPTPTPLPDALLRRFRDEAFVDGALTDLAAERAAAAVTAVLDAGGVTAGRDVLPALIAGWLADLERSFGPLPPGPVDGRFVDGVVAAAGRR